MFNYITNGHHYCFIKQLKEQTKSKKGKKVKTQSNFLPNIPSKLFICVLQRYWASNKKIF